MLAGEHQRALCKESFGGGRSAESGTGEPSRMWLLDGLVQRLLDRGSDSAQNLKLVAWVRVLGMLRMRLGVRKGEGGGGSSRLLMLLERPPGCNSGFGALSQRDCLPRSPVQGELR